MWLWLAATLVASASAASSPRRNVLYLVFDDLRPELPFYGQDYITAPHLSRLAATGTVFNRAYCQQAVCSPSRNSFLTGRRPNTTRVWNFINDFRQARCDYTDKVIAKGTVLTSWTIARPELSGGFAQCCTSCTSNPECKGWSYDQPTCQLFSEVKSHHPCGNDICMSGIPGSYMKWTSMPEMFRKNGYLTLGVGKLYHDGGHGLGGSDPDHPGGNGRPPMADGPLSWTQCDVQNVNLTKYYKEWGQFNVAYGSGHYLTPIPNPCPGHIAQCGLSGVAVDGSGAHPPLNDFVTYNDAINKMRYASHNRDTTGQPFFLGVGIKRPHLQWRVPSSYWKSYVNTTKVKLPVHPTLSKTINPIAFTPWPEFQNEDPYKALPEETVLAHRTGYQSAVTWADYAVGRVLTELDNLGLTNDTLVVMHADHGWHLGEYNMWEKRSLWELATRVPLVIRAPWLPDSRGQKTNAFAELVDVMPTMADLMGVPLPPGEFIEGKSLRPVLENPQTGTVKSYALSTYPRCPHPGHPIYDDNNCLGLEMTALPYMGYSIRTDRYRYTQWMPWNGTALQPLWDKVHSRELYDHQGDDGTNFDKFENVNVATTVDPDVLKQLEELLKSAFT